MRRWVFNLTTAVSLLLFVGTAVLWVRSYWTADLFQGYRVGSYSQFRSSRGEIEWGQWASVPVTEQGVRHSTEKASNIHWPNTGNVFGPRFGIGYNQSAIGPIHARGVLLPYWLIVAAAGAMPGLWLANYPRKLREKRLRLGLCVSCGYDLFGSPDRCPECGAVPGEIHAEGSVANRLVLLCVHAVGLAASAIAGWYVLSFMLTPVDSIAGVVGTIALFLAWQVVVAFFALGVLMAGYGSDDTEMLVGFLLGPMFGSFGGWSVAGYGGLCFGAGAGLFVGPAVGWFRGLLVSRFYTDN